MQKTLKMCTRSNQELELHHTHLFDFFIFKAIKIFKKLAKLKYIKIMLKNFLVLYNVIMCPHPVLLYIIVSTRKTF